MRCESKWKAELGGKLRAEQARAEQPDGYAQACARNGSNSLIWRSGLEIGLQLLDVLRKVVGGGSYIAAKGVRGRLVGSGSTPESEIDAAWIERSERAELLRDDQWGMVRQHDAAGADSDRFGTAGNVANDDGRGGAGDAGHVVMFGQPKTIVAPYFGALREIE